jgi:2-dehydro-3-deoxyphosphogluconate aldolase/4-hydroxy-2-oxoglutarate aldolase
VIRIYEYNLKITSLIVYVFIILEVKMRKEQVITRMKEDCLVAVVRAKNKEQGEKVIDAIIAGGINFIEITMTMDEGNPVEFIQFMSEKYRSNEKVVIGAGTVLDPETARAVILAGANYVVSPGLNVDTIKLCNRYRIPMLPGVMSPTEAITALESGCDIIKVFPGNVVGPGAISSFKGPLPQGDFMPSGGVDVDNVDKWLKAGACAVGTGSSLTKGAKTGDFAAVTEKAREFVEAVAAARK